MKFTCYVIPTNHISLEITIAKHKQLAPEDMVMQSSIIRKSIIQDVGNSKSRTNEQREAAKAAIEEFHRDNCGNSILVYTDGSIHNRKKEQLPQSLGFGACAAVLIPLEEETAVVTSKCVGTMTDNVECEVVGIKIALSAISEYSSHRHCMQSE